jgi:hypothetical protein
VCSSDLFEALCEKSSQEISRMVADDRELLSTMNE